MIETHIRVLGILNVGAGTLNGFLALMNLLFFGGPFALGAYFGVNHVVAVVWVTAALALTIPSIVEGLGLISLRGWARTLGIVMSIFQMLVVPLGTIVGVYGLVVLFSETADMIFTRRYGTYVTGKR